MLRFPEFCPRVSGERCRVITTTRFARRIPQILGRAAVSLVTFHAAPVGRSTPAAAEADFWRRTILQCPLSESGEAIFRAGPAIWAGYRTLLASSSRPAAALCHLPRYALWLIVVLNYQAS